MDKLENIGFYTLSDNRVKNSSEFSPLYRAEFILTDNCNFSCPYCRGLREDLRGEYSFDECIKAIKELVRHNLKNIRFSGGEPTLYPKLEQLVSFCKENNVERIAVSTNGSSNFCKYLELINAGVNDFSISLDACCSATGEKMSGRKGMWEKVISNIKEISKLTYTTVGIVVTEDNIDEAIDTIKLAHNLGVSDIRVIPAAQFSKKLTLEQLDNLKDVFEKHPILKYRINNMCNNGVVRGLKETDNKHCPLVLDDIAIAQNKHFPCIIYMREYGNPIGEMKDIEYVRQERKIWAENHNCFEDKICRDNCLDCIVLYNKKWKELHGNK